MRVTDKTAPIIGEAFQEPQVGKKKSQVSNKKPYRQWEDLTTTHKIVFFTKLIARLLAVLFMIFVYVCTLDTLATAFLMLSSRGLGQAIRDSWIIRDPASALIVGMLITVVVQSSTTFINVLVSMVAANMITVHMAIPMMIGSELGTSFVNGIISMSYAGDRNSFKRAFSAAIIGDVYNLCCILLVLPLELITGFIEQISWWIVDPLIGEQGMQFKTLEYLTDPVNDLIIQVDKSGLRNATVSDTYLPSEFSFIKKCITSDGFTIVNCETRHIFAWTTLTDATVAKIIIVFSIIILIICLFLIVYLINRIMRGRVKAYIQKWIEMECPGCWKPCTGYCILAVGLVLTLLVQSNSVFSSSLTPLAGAGVISLDKLYALTLGSNIGTTFSGVLAAMTADAAFFEKALHMAMCQVIYNIIGTLLFYPIPAMREVPLSIGKMIGNVTAKYRWFVFFYLGVLFVVIPVVVISLSLFPPALTISCFVLLYIGFGAFGCLVLVQKRRPELLPKQLHDFSFLPIWARSLKPYDKIISDYSRKVPFLHKLFGNDDQQPETKQVGMLIRLSKQTEV